MTSSLTMQFTYIISILRFGSDDATTVLRDRTFMEEMKADILRRVEEPSDSEEEVVDIFGFAGDRAKGKGKVREVAFDDELDSISSVRIAGDGEESSEDEDEGEEPEPSIESILELAYMTNPKVFERDAATRRSKERAVLRAQTGAPATYLPRSLLTTYLKAGWTNKSKDSKSCSIEMYVRSSVRAHVPSRLIISPAKDKR